MAPKKRKASSASTGDNAKRARTSIATSHASGSAASTTDELRARGWLDEHSVIIHSSRRTRRETRSTASEHARLLDERARQEQQRQIRVARRNALRRNRTERPSRSPPQARPARPQPEPSAQLLPAPQLQPAAQLSSSVPFPPARLLWNTPERSAQPEHTSSARSAMNTLTSGFAQFATPGAQSNMASPSAPVTSQLLASQSRTTAVDDRGMSTPSFGQPSFNPVSPHRDNDSTIVLSPPAPLPSTPASVSSAAPGPAPPSSHTPSGPSSDPRRLGSSHRRRRVQDPSALRRDVIQRSARRTQASSSQASGASALPTSAPSASASRATPAQTPQAASQTPLDSSRLTFGSLFTGTPPRVSAGSDWWVGNEASTPTPATQAGPRSLPVDQSFYHDSATAGPSRRDAQPAGASAQQRPAAAAPEQSSARNGNQGGGDGDDGDGSTTNSNTDSEDEDQTPFSASAGPSHSRFRHERRDRRDDGDNDGNNGGSSNTATSTSQSTAPSVADSSRSRYGGTQQTSASFLTPTQSDEQRARLAAINETLDAVEGGTFVPPLPFAYNRLPEIREPRPTRPAREVEVPGISTLLSEIAASRRPGEKDKDGTDKPKGDSGR